MHWESIGGQKFSIRKLATDMAMLVRTITLEKISNELLKKNKKWNYAVGDSSNNS